ncbi:uncharacterized protein [Pleurodeles waltl]|uniref:uncharacterized protein n=1 Tax=Pleurodeles waltl TaxID=8319 RepID=UPI003709B9B1
MAEAGSSSRASATRTPCGRRRRSGVQPRPIFTEAEVAALIFWVQRHLPSMLAVGGRPGSGYSLRERRVRWGRVRRCVRRSTGGQRTTQQLTHRWADIINREQDLLDLLGVEVPGLPAQITSTGASGRHESAGSATEEAQVVGGEGAPVLSRKRSTPAAESTPSRQKIAARLRQHKMEIIAAEYRRLVAMEEEEEETRSSRPSSQPGPSPPSQPHQCQRCQQPGSTMDATQQSLRPSSSSTTNRLLRRALRELELIHLGQQNLAHEVACLHARLDAL